MDLDPAIPAPEAPDAPAAAELDAARALIDRQMARLERLADVGMEVVEAIGRQARLVLNDAAPDDAESAAGPAPAAIFPNLDLAYARASRAVRMTLALQLRLTETLQTMEWKAESEARIAAVFADAADEAQAEADERLAERIERIEDIVANVAEVDHAESEEGVERFAREARERLDDEDEYGDLMARPVSEIIEQICADLGLAPDWMRLDEETWALQERWDRNEGAPLAAVRARKRAAREAAPEAPPIQTAPPPDNPAQPRPPERLAPETPPPPVSHGLPGEYPPPGRRPRPPDFNFNGRGFA